MQIRVLGAIDVLDPDDVVIGGPTQRRTLSMLSMHAGRVVSVDQLVDAVWPDGAVPERAEHNVRTYVHRLRSALGHAGDRIETAGTGYRFGLERNELDATRFEDVVTGARAAAAEADHERARQLLDEALGLWGGRPYDEFADEEWARAEVTRLSEVRASAIEHRFAALLDAGRHTEVIGPLREAVTEEPWREARRIQLALALYRSGRQAEALKAIQLYQSELAEELGLEPSPELGQLEHQILEHDSSLLPASHQQHMLRGYQLDEVIGEGAFSLVWRGVQPSLGRTVAIKQIRAELANQPDFVRRFETEAQTVAALEHPYIVPLYDYWREPDSAYLVMRYVTGGTLESEVLEHGLEEPRLRRLIDQVGSALGTAHRAGVIHRDVKSANVLSDADGNFYLTDFGIALTGSADDDELATTLSTGSPAYASPEQLRRQGLDDRTDVYGFGITLFEAATGRLPFVDAPTKAALVKRQLEDPVPAPSSVTATVPAWVDNVVARATAKNPADRFGSMAELVAAVPPDATSTVDHGRGVAASTVIGDLVNPFKALRAFREADSADFYGRDRLISRFIDVLTRPGTAGRLLAVVGPSGSGKSSAVRSGLLPRLRTGAVSGSHDWFITTMLPGSHPFDELESALSRVAVRQPGPLVEMMRGDDRGIARAINQILPDEDSELLLVIDQFEEMFTHTDDAERARFLDGLLAAVREPRSRLRLVVTIRADFLDRPLRHPGLAARLETATITVSPLAADELEAAIVEPVRRQGAVYEPGLVARIIADVGDQPGALPLLQYALTELFDTNVSGLLQAESYDAIGGLTGALGARADDTLEGLTAGQQADARRLFGRLVTFGDGTEDTRRRVRRGELGDGPDTTAVIDTFGAARLLVFDHDPSTREPTVEIAHEALLQAWPRLRGWLDEDRDGLRVHRHLTDTTAAWLALGRDEGELYRGGRLESAAAWAADHGGDLNQAEREFLDASVATHNAELAAEQEHLDTTIRSNRRLRILVSVATVIAVIAALAGVLALQQRSRAKDSAAEADARANEADAARLEAADNATLAQQNAELAEQNAAKALEKAAEAGAQRVEAEAARDSEKASLLRADFDRLISLARSTDPEDPTIGLLLAVEAYRMFDETGRGNFRTESSIIRLDALHRALTARRGFTGSLPTGRIGDDITVLDDGERIVVHTRDTIALWDVAARELLEVWEAPTVERSSRFDIRTTASADGSVVIGAGPASTFIIDVEKGDVRTIENPTGATAVALSVDMRQLAVGFGDGSVVIHDLEDFSETAVFSWGSVPIHDLQWHPDGARLAVAAENGAGMWSLPQAESTWRIDGWFQAGLLSADGQRVVLSSVVPNTPAASVFGSGQMRVLDTTTGEDLVNPIPLEKPGARLAWTDESEDVVAVVSSNRLSLVDIGAGERIDDLGSTTAISNAVAVLPGLGVVATAAGSGVELRSLDGAGPLSRPAPLSPEQAAVGGGFLTSSWDETSRTFATSLAFLPQPPQRYDLDQARLQPVPLPPDQTGAIITGPTGPGPFTAYRTSESITVRRGLDGSAVGSPIVKPDGLNFSALSPRGDRYAEADGDDYVLYDVESGSEIARLPGVGFASFSPDGDVVHGWDGFTSARFDAETGEMIWESDEWGYLYPGPSDEWFATPDQDGAVQFRDPKSHEPIGQPLIGHVGLVGQFVYEPVFNRAVTNGQDRVSRVWDVETRTQIGRALPVNLLGAVAWSPDGKLLALPGPDGFVIWNFDTDTWADIACDVAGRSLTEAEWEEFGPRTRPFHATCPIPDGL